MQHNFNLTPTRLLLDCLHHTWINTFIIINDIDFENIYADSKNICANKRTIVHILQSGIFFIAQARL